MWSLLKCEELLSAAVVVRVLMLIMVVEFINEGVVPIKRGEFWRSENDLNNEKQYC